MVTVQFTLSTVPACSCRLADDGISLQASSLSQCRSLVHHRNDQWDQTFGACGAGAYLNRGKGPRAMLQGAASYGLFSLVFAWQKPTDELDVVDVPVNPRTE